KATKMLDIPNVVGLTEEKAKADIEKLGLVVESEPRDLTTGDKYYEKGYVIAQEPDANSSEKVPEGTVIKIYVSTGVSNYSVKVDIPKELSKYETTGYISLWSNGQMVIEDKNLINFSEKSEYTFENLKSSSKEISFYVKVRFLNDKENNHYTFAEIKVNPRESAIVKYSSKFDYEEYVPKTDEPITTLCEICGAELADGETHTDADHKTCDVCGTVYHKDAEHECQDAE
ncbi:MAG: PASTA domain-containing protein, partial [Clostridia bacterium]|nr:PASTA domain-containing protein [Clostridia bacterium]